MPTNPTDPFDSVKWVHYCKFHACEYGTCGGGEGCSPRFYASIPAMRRAVVKWLQGEANKWRNDPLGGRSEAAHTKTCDELADQLERGGHDEG